MSLKIVHVIPTLQMGGAERLLVAVATNEASEGHEVVVLTLQGATALGERLQCSGVSLRSFWDGARSPLARLIGLFRLIRAVRVSRCDVVMGWMYHASLLVALLSPHRTQRLSSLHHSDPLDSSLSRRTRLLARLLALLSARFHSVIYVSNGSARAHLEAGFRAPVHVIPGGACETEFVLPSEQVRTRVRSEMGLPDAAPVVVHLARYHPEKDQENLLRALARCMCELPGMHAILAGRDLDVQNRELAVMVKSYSLDPSRLHLFGELSEPARVLRAADVFCLSSRTEALPVSLIESMLSGLTPVVTDVGACAEVVADVGFVSPARDSTALARSIMEAVASRNDSRAAAVRMRGLDYSLGETLSRYSELVGGAD